jgi:hypothetical protein
VKKVKKVNIVDVLSIKYEYGTFSPLEYGIFNHVEIIFRKGLRKVLECLKW